MSDLGSTWGATVRRLRADARVTIADVAAAAGVNKGTASRALRGAPNVGADTRRRVLEVAARLHYSASHVASALATGRPGTVGVVLPSLRLWYFRDIASGSSEVFAHAGYRVELIDLDVDPDTIEVDRPEFRGLLTELGAGRDALMFAGAVVTGVGAAVQSRLPVMAVGSPVSSVAGLVVDNRAGMRAATEHLLELGHRHLALVDGRPPGHPEARVWRERTEGCRDALRGHGLQLADADVVVAGGAGPEHGESAVHELLHTRRSAATAIVCHTDELAFGAMSWLRRRGVRVPESVSVVGFDGHPGAPYWGLTTVDQHAYSQGRRAAESFLTTLEPEHDVTSVPLVPGDLAVELVVRESTGLPRTEPPS